MIKTLGDTLRLSICAALIIQLTGCGTIMYPERKGQRGGKIDAGVAILDGIGLLLFIIPGVIAFAVDFNNGTIYLPGGSLRSSVDLNTIKEVKFDPKQGSMMNIAKIIRKETGKDVALDQPNVQITKLQSTDDMLVKFAKLSPSSQQDRIALLTRRSE